MAGRNLATWKEYEVGIQQLKPWVEQAEMKAATIGSKPSTLAQAVGMLETAKAFEKQCEEQLPQVQELSVISQQITGRTVAPDEVDAVHTRWNSVHDVAIHTATKLDKLVSSWNNFESEAKEFNTWLNNSEKGSVQEPNVKTPETAKLERELARLKEFNKDISDRQAQLISLTQVSDHISHGLALEGASNLKARVTEMKSRVNKLADIVRNQINQVSDALLARQEFQMKLTDFDNWMTRLKSNIDEISDVNADNVDTNLQAVHAYLQEHSDKQPSFASIYEEVKHLSEQSSPQEAAALNELYTTLATKYKALEDNLNQKKKGLEKWAELLSWHADTSAQLSHSKYQVDAHKPTVSDLERLTSELQTMSTKIDVWKVQVPQVDTAMGIQVRDKLEKPLTASALVNELEAKAVTLQTELATKRDKLENLSARWDNFRKTQQTLTEKITHTQTTLQDITYKVDTCEKLAPAVEEIEQLIADHRQREPDKETLHREGNTLMKEDQRAVTNIQVVLSSTDSNWEKVNELLREQKNKYADMDADWKLFLEAKKKLSSHLKQSKTLCQSIQEVPNDITQANSALDKHKKAADVMKKGKQSLEKMDSKAQQLIKEASLMPNFKSDLIEKDLAKMRKQYQDAYAKIVEKTQIYETQVIIWKQIDEAKYELSRWLSDTNEALTSACKNLSDAENGQLKLARYREELPAHQVLRQGIAAKTAQLSKMNNNAAIPTLKSLNDLLDDQFKVVKEAADRLESVTSTFHEKEKIIREELKRSGDAISKIREDIIKCDDLTGENTKILARINKCQALKAELEQANQALADVEKKVADMSSEYPAISKSTLPKELQGLQQRRDGVASHADKVSATLVAFLTKLYHEKFGALQRMVATHKEKAAWCEPEQSSDRYNLEVKMASLVDVETGIADCEARKADTDNSLKLLESVESKETMVGLKAERDKVAADLKSLKKSYAKIKQVLDRNIALWQRYELMSENVSSWLKETENKIRIESSVQLTLTDVEDKVKEIVEFQTIVSKYETEMKDLSTLGEDIIKVSPESRVGQYVGHLNTRYQAIVKFLSSHLERLEEVGKGRDQYNANVKELEAWIKNAEQKLNKFGEISGPKAITFYQSRLKELKGFADEREKGQVILNRTAEAGEALYARITPENRETIRTELRSLRSQVESLTDRANVIYKRIESDMMHRSSFEDKYSQVKQWVFDAQAKLAEKCHLLPNLQEKKLELHFFRTIAQDVNVHRNILQQLQDRLPTMSDDDAAEMLKTVIDTYDQLSEDVENRISTSEKYVANHESYLQSIEKMRDWINTLVNEAASVTDDLTIDRDNAKAKVALIENILQQKPEGDRIMQEVTAQLNVVLEQTSLEGQQPLLKLHTELKWDEFIAKCIESRDKLNQLFDKWAEFEKVVDSLEAWIKQMEPQVKDQSLKSTEDTKRMHLQKLKALEEEINAKSGDFNAAVEKSQAIEGESELATKVSRQATRYQAIRNQAKEAVARYEQFIKEHSVFNEKYNQFLKWVGDVDAELKNHSQIVGDLSILQTRQKNIRDLGDTRTKENAKFESVIDLGEKLYAHTSPDGREIIRQQLRNLRTVWDGFTEDLQSATQKLDQCLMQFAEFSLSQEQLTTWLRDVERAMHQHTELKSSLQEKRAQLQNHKIMHQEIMSHQALVESVCDKAQQLVDQTKDTSLNVYLQSIKQLFQNIVGKSQDLLENLEDCVDKHNQFNAQCKSFTDWLSGEREKLLDCNDIVGEKGEISRRIATLAVLKDGQTQGANRLASLKDLGATVAKSTAPKGQHSVTKEIASLEADLHQHLSEIGKTRHQYY